MKFLKQLDYLRIGIEKKQNSSIKNNNNNNNNKYRESVCVCVSKKKIKLFYFTSFFFFSYIYRQKYPFCFINLGGPKGSPHPASPFLLLRFFPFLLSLS